MNELSTLMTVKEVAQVLNVDETTIQKHAKTLYPDIVKNGVRTYLNEKQVTEIKMLIERSGRNDLENIRALYDYKPAKLMAVKEVAKILQVSERLIQEKVKELYPEILKNGVKTLLNESQVTHIKLEISKNQHLARSCELPKTDLEKQMIVAQAMNILQEQIDQLKKQAELDKPKTKFFDAVTGSADVIDMSSVAKILNYKNLGRNKIFEILRTEGVLRQNNQPYQKFVDAGYFRLVESSYILQDGSEHISIKTVVFQKGVDYIRKIIDKHYR